MSSYVTLSSHVQKSEFPDNHPSEFKVRLPGDRLWQKDDRWEVGLSGASFPIILPPPPPEKTHPENILVHEAYRGVGHPDKWNKEGYLCTFYYTTIKNKRVARNLRGVVLLSEITPLSTGVEFVKKALHKMTQKMTSSLKAGELLYFDLVDTS